MAEKNSSKTIRVAEWMTETVLAVETYDSIGVARELMAKHRVNQLPVLDHDVVVGIVTDRDLRDAYPTSMAIAETKKIDEFAARYTVEEVMTHNVFTVEPETPLETAVSLLRRHRIGSLPVIKNKSLVGIITRSDILDFILSGGVLKPAQAQRKPIESTKRAAKNSVRRR
ncbi:MAG TPA: CBS domain-containing protein [Candidatus Binatia bacterium]|nr:CBS domain-containing protein [Candidatus Binatia bacterium]